MLSKLRNVLTRVVRRRLGSQLSLLVLLPAAVAGCGGGEGGAATDRQAPASQKPAKQKAPRGGVVRSFSIRVSSPTQATITTNLTRASAVELQVKKLSGSQKVKIGRAELGRRPAGASTFNWNLTAKGKKLTPGRYRLVLHAEKRAGKSHPQIITVPSG